MKTKTPNALLGKMIKHMDENHDILSSKVVDLSKLDDYSTSVLINELVNSHYVIYSNDILTVTELGRLNYISPMKKFFTHYLILGLKEVIVFITGIGIGLAINYFSHLFGW